MTSDSSATVLDPDEDLPAIARERFLLLASQVQRTPPSEWGPGPIAESAAMERMGLDKSQAGQLKGDPKKSVGLVVIAKACKALGLSFAFFFDPTLGKTPDYRDHPSTKPTEEMRQIRDGHRSPYPEFERYIAEREKEGDISKAHASALREIRFRRGNDAATYNAARGAHSGLLNDAHEKASQPGQLIPSTAVEAMKRGGKLRGRKLGG